MPKAENPITQPGRYTEHPGYAVGVPGIDGVLSVYSPESLPMAGGHPSAQAEPVIVKLESLERPGAFVTTTIQLTDVLTAKYWGHTNFSVPDIHDGEKVLLRKYDNLPGYFWSATGRSDSVRTTEHVRVHCANARKRIKVLSDDNTYYIEIDTRKGQKHIRLRTSQGTGEAFAYLLDINPTDGGATLQDNAGNALALKSAINQWKVQNADGCVHEYTGKNCRIFVPGDRVTEITGNDTLKVGKALAESAQTHSLKATSTEVDATATFKKETAFMKIVKFMDMIMPLKGCQWWDKHVKPDAKQ